MKHRILTILAAILVLIVLSGLVWFVRAEPLPLLRSEWTGEQKAWIVYWMEYHGIEGAKCGPEWCEFKRDGQMCRFWRWPVIPT